jgi:hypothetical protein
MGENMEEGLKLFSYTKLEDISAEDKIKAFDRLYKMCLAHAAADLLFFFKCTLSFKKFVPLWSLSGFTLTSKVF